jgi:hypothetical protein
VAKCSGDERDECAKLRRGHAGAIGLYRLKHEEGAADLTVRWGERARGFDERRRADYGRTRVCVSSA